MNNAMKFITVAIDLQAIQYLIEAVDNYKIVSKQSTFDMHFTG